MTSTQTLPNLPPADSVCQLGATELTLAAVGCSSLAACSKLIGRAFTKQIVFTERTKVAGPFADYDDYKRRGLKTSPRNFKVLTLKELPIKIFVFNDYLRLLEVERKRRLAANQGSSPKSEEPVNELAERILPEEVAPLLSSLPNPTYFKRVFLLNTPNWEDDWVRQTYSQTFSSAMAVERNGDVFLFRTNHNRYLRGDIFHEWTHLLSNRFDREYKVFSDALELEWRLWVPRNYALRSYSEHWAVFGEEMLAEDGARFLTACENGPARSVIWMSALSKSLQSVGQEYRSPEHEKLMERCKFVFSCVTPKALEALKQYQSSEDRLTKGRTRRLLKFIQEAQRLG